MKVFSVAAGAGLALTLAGCVNGPAGPESPPPAPPLTGNFTLVVEASAVCRLPTSRYQWDVEGTATGTTAGSSVRLTLPGGDNAVDVSLAIGSSRNGDTTTFTVNGNLTTRTAAFGDDLRVAIGSSVRGTLTAAPDNRGQVTDGVLNGTIALSAPEDRQNNTLGSCTAADHKWTLVPR